MGVDFCDETKSVRKVSRRRALELLISPDMFSKLPSTAKQSLTADIVSSAVVHVGDEVRLAKRGDTFVGMRYGHEVLTTRTVNSEAMNLLEDSGGSAAFIVERVHTLSNKVDLTSK